MTVGLDVGKGEVFAVLRWKDGAFERPWKMKNPIEIMVLTRLLQELAQQRPMMMAKAEGASEPSVLNTTKLLNLNLS